MHTYNLLIIILVKAHRAFCMDEQTRCAGRAYVFLFVYCFNAPSICFTVTVPLGLYHSWAIT